MAPTCRPAQDLEERILLCYVPVPVRTFVTFVLRVFYYLLKIGVFHPQKAKMELESVFIIQKEDLKSLCCYFVYSQAQFVL